MRQAALGFSCACALAIAAAASAPLGASGGEQVDANDVKAAFVLNFAKFAEWPAVAPSDPIIVCVVEDPRLASSLVAIARGQRVDSRRVDVRPLTALDGQACHLLYLSMRAREAGAVLQTLRGAATLTVSDAPRFASAGGMIELFVEGDRMRFAVNVSAVQRSQVRLSSRLLGLARIVKDDHAQ